MVTITDYQLRKAENGKEFFALILQSGLEIIKSQNGSMYATAKKASIPSTFNEETCIGLIGHTLDGSIQRIECDPYVYYLPETGEGVTISHRYEYQPAINNSENQLTANELVN